MSKSHLKQKPALPKPAYIDGGLAAILLQGAIGAGLAALLYVKIYWQKVKSFFTKGGSGSSPGGPEDHGSGS